MSARLDVEAVLAEHRLTGFTVCYCGEAIGDMRGDDEVWQTSHRAHVAAKVREAVAAWVRDMPWTEAARDDILSALAEAAVRDA